MMELQLGLPLPTSMSRTGFDLNCWDFDQANKNCCKKIKKRRRFHEASESGAENDVEVIIPTLPLLLWDKNPHSTNTNRYHSTGV